MKTRLLTAIIFASLTVHGQTTFQKTYGGPESENGMSVGQTTDGGFILFGQTQSYGSGSQDMYLVKTDDEGNEQWSQTYGGADFEFGISAKQTTDGGYILCGAYSGLGNDSLALIKTDASGNEIWNKRYSGTPNRDVGQFVQETADGGFIAVGFTGPTFNEHIYMVKTDSDGNEEWSKVHVSTGRDWAAGVSQTSDRGYVLIGETNSMGFGGKDMLLVKTNSTGDIIWTKTFGTSSDEIGRSLYLTNDDGFILLGFQAFSGGNLYLVKTDALGNEEWSNYYGGAGSDFGHSVQQTSEGGYILAGRKENVIEGINDMYCIKTDLEGEMEWESIFPNGIMSYANSVQQTTDGGYIMLGSTVDTTGVLNFDMYLVKIDGLGLVSVSEKESLTFNVFAYSNPFSEYTTIAFDDAKNREFSLKLMNGQGKVL